MEVIWDTERFEFLDSLILSVIAESSIRSEVLFIICWKLGDGVLDVALINLRAFYLLLTVSESESESRLESLDLLLLELSDDLPAREDDGIIKCTNNNQLV